MIIGATDIINLHSILSQAVLNTKNQQKKVEALHRLPVEP